MPLQVNERDPRMNRMAATWPKLEALKGGTPAMRKANKAYLPPQPKEDAEDYAYRLATSTLFPAFMRTSGVMAGKPFSKELTLNKVPAAVEQLLSDVDGQGRSLHAFASDVFADCGIEFGFGGILVDFTKTEEDVKTVADEKRAGLRPYWVHIKKDQILGYKAENRDGTMVLTQLRLSEVKEEPDGEYGTTFVDMVRVLYPDRWELWRAAADGKNWVLDSDGKMSIGVIPFVPLYGVRMGFMEGVSPLLDLADLNIKHWQQQSDQDDSTRFARKRMVVFTGINSADEMTVASNYAIQLPKDADAKVVQGSAESVTVGRTELTALEQQMIQTGAELLVALPGQRTATEASNDAEANKSMLQSIVENFEDALDAALQLTSDWLGAGEGGTVSLFKDFAAATLTDASAQLVLSMNMQGLITKETALKEMQRRAVLSPDLDVKTEVGLAEDDAPDLGAKTPE